MKINPIQEFEDSTIDLSVKPDIYKRFVELTDTLPHSEYDNKTHQEAIKELDSSPLYQELPEEEKQIMLDKITDDFTEEAKEKLKMEYPVIDQLILEDNLRKEQQQ